LGREIDDGLLKEAKVKRAKEIATNQELTHFIARAG
jgi:hypothetical protein